MAPESSPWIEALLALRNPDGGWPYYRGRRSRLEPTCWALVALGAAIDETPLPSWRRSDGLLVEPEVGEVNYAFNALAALAASPRRRSPHVITESVIRALLSARGVVIPPSPHIRQDTSLQGWSWTAGTFTWIEPTAWCLLAIKRWPGDPAATAERIRDGEGVLQDRVCPGGGWNFGNGEVYGQGLPAHVPPTALGVLALQDRQDRSMVRDAVGFLERSAAREGSTTALATAAMALMAVARPVDDLLERLGVRLAVATSVGNVASLAMAAHALTSHAAGVRPFDAPRRQG